MSHLSFPDRVERHFTVISTSETTNAEFLGPIGDPRILNPFLELLAGAWADLAKTIPKDRDFDAASTGIIFIRIGPQLTSESGNFKFGILVEDSAIGGTSFYGDSH